MTNSKDGQDHKDKYFDTSKKILSQEITICNIETLISYFLEIITNVYFFFKWSNVKVKSFKFQHKDTITSNNHVKYQSSSTHYSNFINRVKVFKTQVRLQGQGHKVKNVGTHGKVLILKNTHVKYQSFSTHFSNVINKVKVLVLKKVGQIPRSRSQLLVPK